MNGNDWIHVTLSPAGYNYSFNHVYTMCVDTENNLWVGSEYGLRKFTAGNNSTFTLYDTNNSPLPSPYILDVEADPSGGIWIGTSAGLVRFDGTNQMIYNQANTGMPGRIVYDVARRPSDGLIAIANNQPETFPHTGGVSTFDGITWRHYTPNNSPLTHWQVVAVEFDANGNLWASPLSEGVVQIMIGNTPTPTPTPTDQPNCHTDSYFECNTNCHSNGYRDAKTQRITKVAARTAASRNSTTETLTLPVGAAQQTN